MSTTPDTKTVTDLTDEAVKNAKLLAALADSPELAARLGIDLSVLQEVQTEESALASARRVLQKMENQDAEAAENMVNLSRELAALTAEHIKMGRANSEGKATRSFTLTTAHGTFRVALG